MRLIVFVFSIMVLASCQTDKAQVIKNQGQAHGTFYHITYKSPNGKDYYKELKDNMQRIDKSLSTYDEVSVISRVNMNDPSVVLDDHFMAVYNRALDIAKHTYGAFDMTVAPLVNAWGFGYTEPQNTDSATINALLEKIGYEKVTIIDGEIIKEYPDIKLDASAIAKGYSVDQAALLLERKGIENYMVEIGGEVRTKGKNPDNERWRIGIDEPTENNPLTDRQLQRILHISGQSLATSGNYRQYYVKNGKKYAHTINPKTGYPVQHNLLSVSVVANDCMTADAYATAFMVLGYHASIDIVENTPELEAYFILSGTDETPFRVEYSEGMEQFFN
ncbi:MAG: FAD:protein FMN transferase [Salinivirgaceae bacterium]|jgi:thiamine biosynthesis lipoprotein|nr:FAD:protein FMN transferase [Salinivirgaceae bacterium]